MEKDKIPTFKPISEWIQLTYEELKEEIKKNIMGFGMGGSTAHYHFAGEYKKKVDNTELKQSVDSILLELIGDIIYGGRAIFICTDLRIEGAKEKICSALKKADDLFERMKQTPAVKDWSTYFGYLWELNSAVGRLNIEEAKDFLIKQLYPLKGPMPEPVTKEYYLYHLAKSALEALRKIDPESVKKYT